MCQICADMFPPEEQVSVRDRVLQSIDHERNRQDEKWGSQRNKPDGTDPDYASKRDFYRKQCDERAARGEGSWLDIMLEEVFEAAAETDRAALRAELVQVAAVAVVWIEDLDTRVPAD